MKEVREDPLLLLLLLLISPVLDKLCSCLWERAWFSGIIVVGLGSGEYERVLPSSGGGCNESGCRAERIQCGQTCAWMQ